MALLSILKELFERDLMRLHREISLYENDTLLWLTDKEIPNSAGNLCLHLLGNLNTYIGAELGKTGYIRHRELEFSTKNLSKETLLQGIEETRVMIQASLTNLSEVDLAQEYPMLVFTEKTSTEFLLVHLTTHLTYHLGQINYHRRFFTK